MHGSSSLSLTAAGMQIGYVLIYSRALTRSDSLLLSNDPMAPFRFRTRLLATPSVTIIVGTTCWGHVTGVTETNVRPFAVNWTGTGSVVGSGDSESLMLAAGQNMVSEVVNTGAVTVELTQNQYAAGDTVTLAYRTGATQAACEAAGWTNYTVPFTSSGYVQIKATSTL
jgi:hypothetical protein